jgi:hypothetical protein
MGGGLEVKRYHSFIDENHFARLKYGRFSKVQSHNQRLQNLRELKLSETN